MLLSWSWDEKCPKISQYILRSDIGMNRISIYVFINICIKTSLLFKNKVYLVWSFSTEKKKQKGEMKVVQLNLLRKAVHKLVQCPEVFFPLSVLVSVCVFHCQYLALCYIPLWCLSVYLRMSYLPHCLSLIASFSSFLKSVYSCLYMINTIIQMWTFYVVLLDIVSNKK